MPITSKRGLKLLPADQATMEIMLRKYSFQSLSQPKKEGFYLDETST